MRNITFILSILLCYNTISLFAQDGLVDTSFHSILNTGPNGGVIFAIAIQDDQKIIVGGQFTTYNGTVSPRLIRLNTDGTVDTTFNIGTGFNSQVFTVTVQNDGKLIVGGQFNAYDGTTSPRLVRLNSDGSFDTTFNIGTGFNGVVFTTAIQDDGKIIVGGTFNTYNGTSVNRIVRLNIDGSLDTSFNIGTGFDSPVRALKIQDDGKIIVGGQFNTYNSIASSKLVRLSTDGTLDTSFNIGTGLDSTVFTISILSNGKIIVGGDFNVFNGTSSIRLVQLNSDGSLDTSLNVGAGFNNDVLTATIQADGKIIVGGQFTGYQGVIVPGIARLNPDGSLDRTFNISTGFDNTVRTITMQDDGNVIAGGQFNTYNGILVNKITRLIGTVSFPISGHTDLANTINFDGIGDYINCGIDSAFDFTAGTIEAWVKPGSYNSDKVILANRTSANASQTRWSIHLNEFNNTVGVYNGTNFTTINVGTINPDVWYHIAIKMNDSFTRVYVNGVDRGSINIGLNTSSTGNPLLIGASNIINSFTNEYFEGAIDEIRIWSRILSDSEIQVNSQSCGLEGNQTDLVAYYKFDQGIASGDNSTETLLNDTSGNERHGSLVGFTLNGEDSNWVDDSPIMPSNPSVISSIIYNEGDMASPLTATIGDNGTGLLWYTSETGGTGSTVAPTPDTSIVDDTSYWVSSTNANGCESERVEIVVTVNALVLANALNFDGINDYVDLGDTIESLGNCTFESWVYHSSTGTSVFDEIYSKQFVNSLNIWRAGGSKVWFHLGNGTSWFNGGQITSNASIPFDQWTHIAVTWEEATSTVKIYINGILDITSQHTDSGGSFMGGNTSTRGIGFYPGASSFSYYKGSIDELRVWNRVLTEQEIQSKSSGCEIDNLEPGLIAYYQFNQGVDEADNTGETNLTDITGNGNNGTLTNFELNGATSNWSAGSSVITGSIVPSTPSVTTPITYNEGDIAVLLTATVGANGTALLWYTSEIGGAGVMTNPIPDTSIIGDTSYWVSSINDNGCESSRVEIIVQVNETLNTDDFVKNSITIYPNPTSSYVSLKYIDEQQLNLEIYDINGRLILSKRDLNTNDSIDLQNFENGMYLFKFETLLGEVVKRVIKN